MTRKGCQRRMQGRSERVAGMEGWVLECCEERERERERERRRRWNCVGRRKVLKKEREKKEEHLKREKKKKTWIFNHSPILHR